MMPEVDMLLAVRRLEGCGAVVVPGIHGQRIVAAQPKPEQQHLN